MNQVAAARTEWRGIPAWDSDGGRRRCTDRAASTSVSADTSGPRLGGNLQHQHARKCISRRRRTCGSVQYTERRFSSRLARTASWPNERGGRTASGHGTAVVEARVTICSGAARKKKLRSHCQRLVEDENLDENCKSRPSHANGRWTVLYPIRHQVSVGFVKWLSPPTDIQKSRQRVQHHSRARRRR